MPRAPIKFADAFMGAFFSQRDYREGQRRFDEEQAAQAAARQQAQSNFQKGFDQDRFLADRSFNREGERFVEEDRRYQDELEFRKESAANQASLLGLNLAQGRREEEEYQWNRKQRTDANSILRGYNRIATGIADVGQPAFTTTEPMGRFGQGLAGFVGGGGSMLANIASGVHDTIFPDQTRYLPDPKGQAGNYVGHINSVIEAEARRIAADTGERWQDYVGPAKSSAIVVNSIYKELAAIEDEPISRKQKTALRYNILSQYGMTFGGINEGMNQMRQRAAAVLQPETPAQEEQ